VISDESNHLERGPSIAEIFTAFLRLGLTAFGGPAMVTYIGELAVSRKRWVPRESFQQGVALAQSVPGATAMQTVCYAGLRARGLRGAAAAYIGFVLPSLVFMIGLSALYGVTHKRPMSVSIFGGLQVIVVAIVTKAAFTFSRSSIRYWQDALIALGAAVFLGLRGDPILAIASAALLGLVLYTTPQIRRATKGLAATETLPAHLGGVVAIVACGSLVVAVLFFIDRRLFDLSLLMMKVDIFAFGGGFASLPVMLHDVVQAKKWLSAGAFMDGIALGQVTPGPIVITAAFVGYQLAGVAGGIIGSVAVFFPSFVVVVTVAPYFDRLRGNLWFQRAVRGILASFVGLLLSVAFHFGMAAHWTPVSAIMGCAALVALLAKVDILWVVLAGAALSALFLR
jgi:chromate transporter